MKFVSTENPLCSLEICGWWGGEKKEAAYEKLIAAGEPLRVLVDFLMPTKPWIAWVGIDKEIFAALQQALLNLKDPKALRALSKGGFLFGGDGDFASIRRSIEHNSRFFGKQTTIRDVG
ncbi:MAG: hypothetical protein ABW168_12835 [Sedimenticola sp.]